MRADDTCRSCRKPIRWAIHETTGRRMPLDVDARPDGNVVIVEWREGRPHALPVVAVGKSAISRAVTSYRYVSHFATCPNSTRHRRKKG